MLLRLGIASTHLSRAPAGRRCACCPTARAAQRALRLRRRPRAGHRQRQYRRVRGARSALPTPRSRRGSRPSPPPIAARPTASASSPRSTAIEPDGEADVFDVQIPGVNAFDANGLYVHNCGEQPLPPYGACLLGSINLAALVKDPFTPQARLDMDELAALVPRAVRHARQRHRRVALPARGADARGQGQAPHRARRHRARRRADPVRRALWLGRGGGADRELDARHPARRLSRLGRAGARRKARSRCSTATPISPAKAIAELEPDVRDGHRRARHPQRAADLGRADRHDLDLRRQCLVGPRAGVQLQLHAQRADARRHARARKTSPTTPIACSAASRAKARRCPSISSTRSRSRPADHLVMQAAVQKYVDSSISKTINIPVDFPFERFKDVYLRAYELGCKGCTTYRPNEVTGSVLSVKTGQEGTEAGGAAADDAAARHQAGRHLRGGRRRPHDPAARPARGPARPDLQDQLAGQRRTRSTSPSTTSCRTAAAGRSRFSSTPRTWSITPGPWR